VAGDYKKKEKRDERYQIFAIKNDRERVSRGLSVTD
jgi:hypothetical protein